MGKIIAVANQKGGVGKTTSSINLSASLCVQGYRVLLIDMDPQGNATMGSGVDKNDLTYTCKDVMLGEADLEQAVVESSGGYDLLPANSELTIAEVTLLKKQGREFKLHEALEPYRDEYDFIFIDCPPSLNMLTVNSMAAADGVIITMQCEYYALEGLASLIKTIDDIRINLNGKLCVEGVLQTMFDGRNRLTNDVAEQLREYFGNKVFKTMIPRNVRLAEAPSFGLPAILYDKRSPGAKAYKNLAVEFLKRQKLPKKKKKVKVAKAEVEYSYE